VPSWLAGAIARKYPIPPLGVVHLALIVALIVKVMSGAGLRDHDAAAGRPMAGSSRRTASLT
jgi:hypothetical protein